MTDRDNSSPHFTMAQDMVDYISKKVDSIAEWGEKETLEAHRLEDYLMRQVITWLYTYNPDVLTKEILRPMIKSFDINFDRWAFVKNS